MEGNVQSLGLGTIVLWSLYGVSVKPATLSKIVKDNNLDGLVNVPADLDPAQQIRRAARDFHPSGWRAEVVYDEPSEITVGLQEHNKDVAAREAGWTQKAWVSFDPSTGREIARNGNGEVDKFIEIVTKYLTFLDDAWIRPSMVQRVLDHSHAVALRRAGGAVFVPVSYRDDILRLQSALTAFSGSQMDILDIENTPASVQAVESNVKVALQDAVKDIQDRVDAWSAKVNRGTVQDAMTEFMALRDEAKFYEATLSVQWVDLVTAMEEATATLETRLAGFPETNGADKGQRGVLPVGRVNPEDVKMVESFVAEGLTKNGGVEVDSFVLTAKGIRFFDPTGDPIRNPWRADGRWGKACRAAGYLPTTYKNGSGAGVFLTMIPGECVEAAKAAVEAAKPAIEPTTEAESAPEVEPVAAEPAAVESEQEVQVNPADDLAAALHDMDKDALAAAYKAATGEDMPKFKKGTFTRKDAEAKILGSAA